MAAHVMLAGLGIVAALVAAGAVLVMGVLDPSVLDTVRRTVPVLIVAVVAALGTILANSVLRGLRMVKAQALAAAGAALFSTILFVAGLLAGPRIPVAAFVAIPFLSTALFNWGFLWRRIRQWPTQGVVRAGARRTGPLLLICAPLLLSSISGDVYGVAVRALVYREADAFTLGLLQACLALSDLYVSFLLASMAADFLPKISGLIERQLPVDVSVNRQIQMCMILAALLIVPGILLARYVLWVAYGTKFLSAVPVLQVLLLAALVRTISWPLILTVMAHGQNKTFLVVEVATYACLLLLSFVLQRVFGIIGVAFAFNIVYASYLAVLIAVCAVRYTVKFDRRTTVSALLLILSCYAIASTVSLGGILFTVIACIIGLCTVAYCLYELGKMGIADHLIGKIRALLFGRKHGSV